MTSPICWAHKRKNLLQTLLFCLAIAAAQHAFSPELGWQIPLVYSLCIGLCTWALVDFGRHAFASAARTGWPQGMAALGLPLGGMALGYVLGTLAADRWFGWSSWSIAGRLSLPVSLGIAALSGTMACYYFYAKSRTLYLAAAVAEARQQASAARVQLLESQLEPHMLFNTLANLRALIGSDPARAQSMLDHLNGYLRATLAATRSASPHTLAQELERLQDYLELMAIRMGTRLHYTIEVPEDMRQLPLPAMLLQPLVENSIRHGLEPMVEGGGIHIAAHRKDQQVCIAVRDTGLGLGTSDGAAAASLPGTGLGLGLVRERLATLYPGTGTLQLSSPPGGGTCATITLPAPA